MVFGRPYHRDVYLNMVAGGFSNDLVSLDDATPHDRRYDRLVEYAKIVMRLLSSEAPVSFDVNFIASGTSSCVHHWRMN